MQVYLTAGGHCRCLLVLSLPTAPVMASVPSFKGCPLAQAQTVLPLSVWMHCHSVTMYRLSAFSASLQRDPPALAQSQAARAMLAVQPGLPQISTHAPLLGALAAQPRGRPCLKLNCATHPWVAAACPIRHLCTLKLT